MLDKTYNDTYYNINKCSFCPHSLVNEIGRLTCQSSSCLLTATQLENMMKIIFGDKKI